MPISRQKACPLATLLGLYVDPTTPVDPQLVSEEPAPTRLGRLHAGLRSGSRATVTHAHARAQTPSVLTSLR